jgi:hypothetical protein
MHDDTKPSYGKLAISLDILRILFLLAFFVGSVWALVSFFCAGGMC